VKMNMSIKKVSRKSKDKTAGEPQDGVAENPSLDVTPLDSHNTQKRMRVGGIVPYVKK
jgi:hypothetical protein